MGMEGNFVIPCNVGGTKDMSALVDQGSDVNIMPLSVYNRLTAEKLVETDVRLALASSSHIYPLGVAEDVLVEVTGFVYPVDFMILDIKKDVKKPLILGTPFLTTARVEIKFDKGTIRLRSEKSMVQLHISLAPFPILEERDENKINTLSVVNERILEWEDKIKFHHMKELKFKA
ncbi:reverse transcriptase domain-containing protein [Tanacetum coccineum]